MMEMSLANLFLSFIAGITSVVNPCVLPVLPIIMTGTHEDHRWRPVLIVLGLSITFIVMGVISSLFGGLLGGIMLRVERVVGVIVVLMGILMMANINPFAGITVFNRLQVSSGGRWSGLLLGLSLGIIWIPCIGPILSGVLAMVAVEGKVVSGVVLLSVYSLGFSIPMLIAGYGLQFFRQKTSIARGHPRIVRFVSGMILVLFGLYIIRSGLIGFGI